MRRCTSCHTYFDPDEGSAGNIMAFCSGECYAKHYKKPKFKKRTQSVAPATAEAVKYKDEYRCRGCWSQDNLHLHHIKYRSEGGSHDPSNLITLCESCHDMVHSDKERWQHLCKALADLRELQGDTLFKLNDFERT